jgi:pantoate--beta-alanine ligase
MGYLHAGHESLIQRAKAENDRVVVSIFVNPTQFGPNEDLEAHPRDWERDETICRSHSVSAIFSPEPREMYPEGFATTISLPNLAKVLCGSARPSHFGGVCLVCTKLFNIVQPHKAYFGLKDAQQYFILRRLVRDINLDLELIPCPIVREADGLALSSRNAYLNSAERKVAPIMSKALLEAKEAVVKGETKASLITGMIEKTVAHEPLAKLEYAQVVETEGLNQVQEISGEVLVAAAMWLGKTRLIDNFIIDPNKIR